MRKVIFLLVSTIAATVYSAFGTDSVTRSRKVELVPDQCLISGEENGTVRTSVGENVAMACKLSTKKLVCGSAKNQEEYKLELESAEFFLAKSKSGNVFILGDLTKNKYSIASSHLIAEKGMLMTKHCVGKIK